MAFFSLLLVSTCIMNYDLIDDATINLFEFLTSHFLFWILGTLRFFDQTTGMHRRVVPSKTFFTHLIFSLFSQKMSISRSIVEAVRSLDPPGRFLEKDPDAGLWSDVGHKKAVEKTSQALRDGAASLRKQLSADMGDPDFLNAVFDLDPAQDDKEKKQITKEKEKAKENKKIEDGKGKGIENPINAEDKEKVKASDKLKLSKVRCKKCLFECQINI